MHVILRLYRDAYTGLPRAAWLLAAVLLVNRSGMMVVPFLTLWLTVERGLTDTVAGLLLGCYGLGAMFGSLLGGWLNDRIGSGPTMAGSLGLAGVGLIVVGRLEDPVALGVVLCTTATVLESFRPAVSAALMASCPPALQRRAFSLMRLAINLGVAIGPTVGGILATIDYDLLFWVDGLTCMIAAMLVAPVMRAVHAASVVLAHDDTTNSTAARGPWQDRVFLAMVLLTVAIAMVFMQFFSTLPLYLHDRYALDEAEIGLLFAINPIAIVVFEMVLVHRLRNQPALPVAAVGALCVAIGFGILPFGAGIPFAMLCVSIWTLGEMLGSPFEFGFVASRTTPATRGRYFGIYTLSFSTSFMLAPVFGTAVYDGFGPVVLWVGCGVLGTLAAIGYVAVHRAAVREAASAGS